MAQMETRLLFFSLWAQRRAAEGAGGPSGGSSQRSFLQRRGGDGMPPPLTAIRLFHGHSFDLASSFSQEKRAFFFLAIILEGSIVEVGKLVLLSCSLPPIFLEEYADFSRRYAMEWDGKPRTTEQVHFDMKYGPSSTYSTYGRSGHF